MACSVPELPSWPVTVHDTALPILMGIVLGQLMLATLIFACASWLRRSRTTLVMLACVSGGVGSAQPASRKISGSASRVFRYGGVAFSIEGIFVSFVNLPQKTSVGLHVILHTNHLTDCISDETTDN